MLDGEAEEGEMSKKTTHTTYAEWRAVAEFRWAELYDEHYRLKAAMEKVDEERHRLGHAMGNGASGGTVWTIYEFDPCNGNGNH